MKTTSTLALILFSLSSFSQIIPTSGMVSYYPFNGNANDESTNNFNGTVIGASLTFDRFNQPNSAYSFDGIDDYIELPTTTIKGLNAYSYSLWAKVSDLNNQNHGVLYSVGSTNTTRTQALTHQPTKNLYAGSYNVGNSPQQSYIQSDSVSLSEWTHLVVTRDNTTMTFYIDGVEVNKTNDANTNSQNANYGSDVGRAVIGGRSTLENQYYFKGAIDDLRIYNRVLTANEVVQLFNENINTSSELNKTLKENNVLKCFPNPSSNNLNIIITSFEPTKKYHLVIYDLVGKKVHEEILTNAKNNFNLEKLTNKGLYFLNVIDNSNNIIGSDKIIYK
jgi:hypothetical protein